MMAYSGDPSSSPIDEVRFLLGDTNNAALRLSDAEIAYALRKAGNSVGLAAVACCRSIMATLAGQRDETVGSVSISFSQQAKGYADLLAQLIARFSIAGGARAWVGGVSYTQKRTVESNPDWVQPAFKRGNVGPYGDDEHWRLSQGERSLSSAND